MTAVGLLPPAQEAHALSALQGRGDLAIQYLMFGNIYLAISNGNFTFNGDMSLYSAEFQQNMMRTLQALGYKCSIVGNGIITVSW